ncbi:6-bladed beta-propeller [Bacteroides fluxus]|uniref:6-bladed beta-propeller n=1 Tax=Bacteroides fluxus TaxID=626930 RepID=UPI0023535B3F|nr:6-bladed beta-propeller [Bacteroides fluxus]
MRIIYSFYLLLFLVSCGNKGRKEVLSEMEIVPELVTDELPILPPLQMKDMKTHLLFVTPGMEHNLLFFDKETQEVSAWGKLGNGPDDFISALCIGEKENRIKLFDSNLRKCVEYELLLQDTVSLSRLQEYRYRTDSVTLLGLHAMNNGVMVGFAGFGCDNMFVLLNEKMEMIKSFGNIAIEGKPEKNNLQFYGWFTSYKDKLFFVSQLTGYIVCYTIDGENNTIKEWEHYLTEPLYDAETQKWDKENKYGFYDVLCNEDYVFAAFSGKNGLDKKLLPQNILVFTHTGRLVGNIRYKDVSFGKIALSDDSLYTIGEDKLMICNWKNWKLQN